MLPRSPAKLVQLIALLLLVSIFLMLVQRYADGVVAIICFAVAAGVVIFLWTRLKLHQYFFDDERKRRKE
jgi:hypothetical protein